MGATAALVGTFFASNAGTIGAVSAAVGAGATTASILSRPGAPKAQPTTPMPDEASLQLADQKAAAMTVGRTGRASTVLSQTPTSDQLGP